MKILNNKTKHMKKILYEWNYFLKNNFLKEEYDRSTGKLIIYHNTKIDSLKNLYLKARRKNAQISNIKKRLNKQTKDINVIPLTEPYNVYSHDDKQIKIKKITPDLDKSKRSADILSKIKSKHAEKDLNYILSDPGINSMFEPQIFSDDEINRVTDAEVINQSFRNMMGDYYSSGTNFIPGKGDLYGPGLYTWYDYNKDAIEYYGDIVVKFETNIYGYIIFFEDIAKELYGDNWRIEDQTKLLYSHVPGFDYEYIKSLNLNDAIINQQMMNMNINTDDRLAIEIAANKFSDCGIQLSMIKGLIFFMQAGPACVCYNPVDDVNIIAIGKKSDKDEIDWKYNLADFVELYEGYESQIKYDMPFSNSNLIQHDVLTQDDLLKKKNKKRNLSRKQFFK